MFRIPPVCPHPLSIEPPIAKGCTTKAASEPCGDWLWVNSCRIISPHAAQCALGGERLRSESTFLSGFCNILLSPPAFSCEPGSHKCKDITAVAWKFNLIILLHWLLRFKTTVLIKDNHKMSLWMPGYLGVLKCLCWWPLPDDFDTTSSWQGWQCEDDRYDDDHHPHKCRSSRKESLWWWWWWSDMTAARAPILEEGMFSQRKNGCQWRSNPFLPQR